MFVYLAVLALLPAAGRAADLDPTSTDWNGLSMLVATAAKVDIELKVAHALDWSEVDEHQVLLVVAPRVAPEGEARESLQRFVQAGGRLIVADDFGPGGAWLAPFGLKLVDPPVFPTGFEGLPHLPQVRIDPEPRASQIVRAWQRRNARLSPAQFLAHNVTKPIVLNHPGALQVADTGRAVGVIWGRYEGSPLGWLAEADLDGGRVLAVADPSLLMNAMLSRFHDNRQLAANLMRYHCVADRPCQVVLLADISRVAGQFHPKEQPTKVSLRSGLEQLAALLRALAAALQGPLVTPVLVVILLCMLGLPVWRLARTPPPVVPPRTPEPRQLSVLHETVGAWLASGQADFRRPARLLANHLARLLDRVDPALDLGTNGAGVGGRSRRMDATGFALPLRSQAVDEMIRGGRCPPEAGRRLREILASLQGIAREDGPPVSRAEFGQFAADVEWAESLIAHTSGNLASLRSEPTPPARSPIDTEPS